ncbi:S1 family peptidase [Dictyobacter arantiisoli]|uniref:Peptidase S1 domain-containing protein n=1 Tax=Dictyobacter arantiisoli TaxID=2014874 RepID=A0A5A5TA05_9CHLR|nr:serine protease [Dictyobacter arantiisoli]GCF08331.1 hypothetical protein KDI_18950 [Dictyobacter arantiisoli]
MGNKTHMKSTCLSSHSRKLFIYPCILIFLTILTLSTSSQSANADAVPGGNIQNPVVRAVDVAKPAVVRIITTLTGRLTVQLTSQTSVIFPTNGGSYSLSLSGSGTFISSHGDILTADHVIQPPHDKSMDNVLQMEAAQDVADYVNNHFAPQPPYTKEDAYSSLAYGIFRSVAQYDAPKSMVYLSQDYTGKLDATKLTEVPDTDHAAVDKIERTSAVDQKDVAIIHVSMDNTPSVHLEDSSNVSQQDELTIIGYPGNGDLTSGTGADPTSFLTSSVNKIYVSSIKTTSNGAPVIQVGGNVEHGDSGGPALDQQGHIVGVVSFYNSDAQAPIGTSFLQASNSARQLLDNLSLDLKPGKFEQDWEKAITQYTATGPNHWHQAYASLNKLQQDYPDFKAVTPFVAYALDQSRHEKVPELAQPDYLTPLLPALLGLLVTFVLLGLLLWFLLKRKKVQPAYALAPQSQQPVPITPYMPVNNLYNNTFAAADVTYSNNGTGSGFATSNGENPAGYPGNTTSSNAETIMAETAGNGFYAHSAANAVSRESNTPTLTYQTGNAGVPVSEMPEDAVTQVTQTDNVVSTPAAESVHSVESEQEQVEPDPVVPETPAPMWRPTYQQVASKPADDKHQETPLFDETTVRVTPKADPYTPSQQQQHIQDEDNLPYFPVELPAKHFGTPTDKMRRVQRP